MHYFLSLTKLERINFFLFGFSLFCIIANFIFSVQDKESFNTTRRISINIAFNDDVNVINKALDLGAEQDSLNEYSYNSQFLENEYSYSVRKGDTLIKILSDIGFNTRDSYSISKQINKLHDLTGLNVGQDLKFIFSSNNGEKVKIGNLPNNFAMHVEDKIIEGSLSQSSNTYKFKLLKQVFSNKSKLVKGYVNESLYNTAISEGASPSLVMDYIKLLSNDVDFKKEIKPDSEFKILFDYKENSDGKIIDSGNIIYAYLSVRNRKYEVYQYKDSKGGISYYHSDGSNLKNSLLSKPIKNARISSGFGMRFHPILKRKKMHKGVDYAARAGTPIMAAGDGIIQVVRYGAGYGKYLAIKHNSKYSTLYAHMSKFKTGIRSGKRVKRGDIIGYVGSTGNSTGAHLHYEIRKYGKPINPIKVKPLISNPLEGQKLVAFNRQKKKINDMLHKENKIMLASNSSIKKK